MTKHALREHAKQIRGKVDLPHFTSEIIDKIKSLPEFKKAENIMIYYPHGTEFNLLPLMDIDGKKWLLPKVNGEEIDAYFYEKDDDLCTNKWNIPEPCMHEREGSKASLDMVILPGLCADKMGFRLGYGLGFYDRFMRDLPKKCVKVLPVLDELFIDELPKDQWDEPVDIVVSEKNIYRQ